MHRLPASARMLAVAIAVCVALTVSSCASPPAVVPLTTAQRTERLQQGFDRYWQTIADRYPGAVRPEVSILQIQEGGNLAAVLRACLRRQGATGVSVSADGTIGVDRSATVLTTAQLENQDIALFTCTVEYPRRDLYDSFLSDSQLGALWDYYVGFLQPCLALSGHPVSDAPERARFIATFYTAKRWNPYLGVSFVTARPGDRDILQRCPSSPRWIRN
ncbi:hypothetical protein [Frigoribacterium sp. UYMn621]|jgi:hypothetical protein|uniref:hypothetical protein n=1 Tax=Frigoribacterium sp. UYMn621 TaxID=3156343 RepID=UPI00339B0FE7